MGVMGGEDQSQPELTNGAPPRLPVTAVLRVPPTVIFRSDSPEDCARLEWLTALGQLIPAIAHELGNPLAVIISSLQYARQQLVATGHPADQWTAVALEQAENMRRLLRCMLDMETVRKPSAELSDLNALIEDVLVFVAPECRQRRVAVRVELQRDLARAWVQPAAFKQCLLNLAKNTLEVVGESGGQLAVRTRERPDAAGAIIEVENDGPPIPEEVLPQLFRPFVTTKDCGTGLGLYLCHEFVRQHSGRIVAENLAQGVRFTMQLPFTGAREQR